MSAGRGALKTVAGEVPGQSWGELIAPLEL